MANEKQQVSLSAEQVVSAATAGVELLDLPSLTVPGPLAMGQLGILRMVLQGLASGQLILSTPPVVDNVTPIEQNKKEI